MHATASDGGADGTTEFHIGEERDLRSLKKLLLAAVAAMALVAVAGVSTASATVPSWADSGRHTRTRTSLISPGAVSTSAWASVPEQDPLVPGGSSGQLGGRGLERSIRPTARSRSRSSWAALPRTTAAATTPASISQKAGIAFIKFIVSLASRRQVVYEHQFLVSLDGSAQARPSPVAATSTPATSARPSRAHAGEVHRAYGGVPESASRPAGSAHRGSRSTVKGNLPLKADFSEWGLGDHLTMPDDWGDARGKFADCTAVPNDPTCHTRQTR